MKFFDSEQECLQYVLDELLATLQDDLNSMQKYSEKQNYTKQDIRAMKDKIADIKSIRPRVMVAA